MKKKFESNVAAEIPRTKLHEPELPWKITSDDLSKVEDGQGDLKAVFSGAPPLKTRAAFLVLLVAAVFIFTFFLIINTVTENGKIRQDIQKKDKELSSIKSDFEKLSGEKEDLSESSAQMEKKVSDLAAQKELFTSVIESLTRKSDEMEFDKKEETKTDSTPVTAE